jgi:hypothetical protein
MLGCLAPLPAELVDAALASPVASGVCHQHAEAGARKESCVLERVDARRPGAVTQHDRDAVVEGTYHAESSVPSDATIVRFS